ncbi:MAG: acyltransferase [Promethearchaeota archaeon]|jgi:acetyltransferase-like isoleucine patch superfamily enzyme
MKKGFIIINTLLVVGTLFIILLMINRIFLTIPVIDTIYDYVVPVLSIIFYTYNLKVYGIILILLVFLILLYAIGYNLAKTNQMAGSILYVFSLFGIVTIVFIATFYTYFSVLFNRDLILTTRLMLIILLLPVNFALSLILFPINIDYFVFFKDLVKARKMWKHHRPEYTVEEKGKMTYINIETDDHVFTPVPMLIVAQHLRSKGFSIAWFVRGAFNHLFSLIITYLIGWPRARNMMFRFMGIKIGKNCHISQKAIPDPLLPELIEFEDGSGCGMGVKLITHNVMNIKHSSFSFGPIKICENARIGAYSVIMPGVTIGKGSIIGARSLVSEDIPSYSIAVGSPAKVVRKFTDSEIEEVNKSYNVETS